MKQFFAALVLLFANLLAFGQEPIELINSQKVVLKAYEYFENEEFEKSIKEYRKVPQGDTNYFVAQYEVTYALYLQEKYEESIKESRRLIYEGTDQMSQYNILGSALDELKQYDEAIAVYNMAIKRFPYSTNLILNKGIVYERKGDVKSAWDTYMELLKISPSFPSAHLRLAKLAESEGKLTQAIMAYSIFLMLEPTSKRSLAVVSDFNKLCDASSTIINTAKNPILKNEFEDLDFLVNNQIALNDKYKIPGKMQFPLNKQLHLVMDKAATSIKEEGFYVQFYLPFFKDFLKSEDFVNFNLLLLASSDNERISKEVKAKIDGIKKTRESCLKRFQDLHGKRSFDWNGQNLTLTYFYYDKFNPEAYGNLNAAGKTMGTFIYFDEEGYIDVIGNFDNMGSREGKWYYFDSKGDTLRMLSYKAGKLNGPYRFFRNGHLSEIGEYINELVEGEVIAFYADGSISNKQIFKNDLREGKSLEYYPSGGIKSDYNYVKGEIDGVAKDYYAHGLLKEDATYKNGKIVGVYKEYYENKNLKKECNFVDGTLEGPYKTYYINGQLEQEGIAAKGQMSGNWTKYYSNGKLKEKSNLDENGKVNGDEITFDYEGRQLRFDTYAKGEWKSVKFYDKYGKVYYETKVSKSGTLVTLYNQFRDKTAEGLFKDDNRQGEWKFYNPNGIVNSIEMYEKGKLDGLIKNFIDKDLLSSAINYSKGEYDGLFTSYHQNGKIKTQGHYMDGNRYGTWINYESNGAIENQYFYFDDRKKDWGYEYLSNGNFYKKYKYVRGILREIHHCDTNGISIDSVSIPTGTARFSLKGMSGKKVYEGGFLNGYAHGKATWYYPNGKVSEQGEYFEGDQNGDWNTYFPNGKVKKKYFKYYGYSTGTWEEYNYFGEPIGKFDYKNGDSHGKNIWLYLDGKVESDISFYEDEKHGESKYYAPSGELRELRYFKNGRLIGYTYMDKTNKLKDTIFMPTGDGQIKAYYANGAMSTSYELYNNRYHNEYKIFYPNGTLQEERFYAHGNEIKPTKSYFSNGKLMRLEPYLMGELHGEVLEYHSNGNPKMKENYVNGYKEGLCEYFDMTGKRIGAYLYVHGEIISILQ